MSGTRDMTSTAFGVEEGWATYRLRQARYYDLGVDCADWAREHFFASSGRKLDLLDVGTGDGVARKYIEAHLDADLINYHAVDNFPRGRQFVYKHEDWSLHDIDLEQGLPGLDSEAYDVVVCEQVLEHLQNPRLVLAEMMRVLRPGGRMLLGVPIFPDGLHLVRRHVVPIMDRLIKLKKTRGHVQAWSKRTFLQTVREACGDLQIEQARGFRIISGGILRPLEYRRWWWQFNRRLGALVPSLCVEVQIVARKPMRTTVAATRLQRAA